MHKRTELAMHSIEAIRQAAGKWSGCGLTIGNFDGVHAGHQSILSQVRTFARHRNVPAVALTFEPHPVRYFHPQHAPFRLTTPIQKCSLLRAYGIDDPVVLIFDESLAEIEPETFVRRILLESMNPELIVVGYDFNFGKNRRGNPELLLAICRDARTDVRIIEPFGTHDEIISSSKIRHLLRDGAVAEGRRLLGRPYTILGTVVPGAGRGQALGFPTANITPDEQLVPANGVYTGYLEFGSELVGAITNIGVRPTFGETEVTIESFVLRADRWQPLDLYRQRVALHLLMKVREERHFTTPSELVEQIRRDVETCEHWLQRDPGADIVREMW